MSRWLDLFRQAAVQIDTPVQLGQKGSVRSGIELTDPNRPNCTGKETENRPEWDATDWQAYFDERAGVREHDGELPRHDAERLALNDCIDWWLTQHPPTPTDDTTGCVHCGAALGDDGVPVLAGGAHTWLHSRCHRSWLAKRQAEAEQALQAMGVAPAIAQRSHSG